MLETELSMVECTRYVPNYNGCDEVRLIWFSPTVAGWQANESLQYPINASFL